MWKIAAAVVAAAAVTFPHVPSTRANAHCLKQWRVVATPAAGLRAVAALSSTNVWAVGTTGIGTPDYHSVVAHWTGGRLTLTQGPKGHSLYGIAAVSLANIWAVGDDGRKAIIEHWNGAGWRRLSTPRGVGVLDDIVMESRRSGWAVGSTTDSRPVAMRWNGRSWRKWVFLRRPSEGYFSAVAALASGKDVWVVGSRGGEHTVNTIDAFAVHRNGRRWREVPAVTRDDADLGYESSDSLDGVAVLSAKNAWAIHSGVVRSDFQRWNGRRWRVVRVLPPNNNLADITAVSARNVWAVGPSSFIPEERQPLIAHWNGTSWKVQQLAVGRPRQSLMGISAISASDIWAAGSNLLARYSCS